MNHNRETKKEVLVEEIEEIKEKRRQEMIRLIEWFSKEIEDESWRTFFRERLKFQVGQSPSEVIAISAQKPEKFIKFIFEKTEEEAKQSLINQLSAEEKKFPIFTGKVIEPPPNCLPPFSLEFPLRIVSLSVNPEDAKSTPSDLIERKEYIESIEQIARYFREDYFSEPNNSKRTYNLLLIDLKDRPLKVSY